jgi:hypothetical protein
MTCVSVIRGRVSMTCVSVAPPVWQYRNGGQAWPDALGASPSWRDLGRDTRQPCLHPATMFVGQAQAGSYPVAPPPTTIIPSINPTCGVPGWLHVVLTHRGMQ